MSEKRLNLDADLLASPMMRERVRDHGYALDLYAALCNVEWLKGGKDWSCSWRYAGRLVAQMRERGEHYMDFYGSGNEGRVADPVRADLAVLGWSPVEMEGCDL